MGSLISYENEEVQKDGDYDQCASISENSESIEEEPFDFGQLPHDLQCTVIEKFEYNQFSCFEQTSALAQNVCASEIFSIPYDMYSVVVNKKTITCSNLYGFTGRWSVPRIPWGVASRPPVQLKAFTVGIMSPLTSGRIQAVTRAFQKNKTKVKYIYFQERITWSVEDMERFIKICSPFSMNFTQFLPRQYFNCPSLQNVQSLRCDTTGCTDEEVVKLKNNAIELISDFVTYKGLNAVLKQWKRREREIEHIYITLGSTNQSIRVEDILRGTEANLIWSWESHEDSILNAISLEELHILEQGEYIYSMWIPNDPENTIFIRITNKLFSVWQGQGESALLLGWLTNDQYYFVTNKCTFCLTEFCEHRRWYSIVRLQKRFPWVYNSIMYTVRTMSVSSALASTFNYLTGERTYYRTSAYDYHSIQGETGVSKALALLRVHFYDYV